MSGPIFHWLALYCLALVAASGLVPEAIATPDFDAHVAALEKRLPSNEFTIVRQPPFVVVGDEPAEQVKQRAVHTVKWAVDRLKKDFFAADPVEIIDIWLFKDKASYEKHAKELFGEKPTTPFGYYSAHHKALVMNISTGGGTLVHEIVHPFMRANFPNCPAWLNEGMGSLYEQCQDKDGHIWGLTNWRLAGLQKDIKAESIVSFEQLTGMDEATFYGEGSGSHYAQARYLCYYLQEKSLLPKFYREFAANQKDDPSGYQTLKRILGNPDMAKFQKEWEQYVLKLKFP